jgi:hypothetical protein
MPKPTIIRTPARDDDALDAAINQRVRELAAQFDCLTEGDFRLLAGVTQGTAEAWRRRGTGPDYVLLGNSYFYPRKAVEEFIRSQTRVCSSTKTASTL